MTAAVAAAFPSSDGGTIVVSVGPSGCAVSLNQRHIGRVEAGAFVLSGAEALPLDDVDIVRITCAAARSGHARLRRAAEDGVSDPVDRIAALVRYEAERLARDLGHGSSLEGWCGIVSGALAVVLRDAGIHAEMAGGWAVIDDYEEGHYWVLVAPTYGVPSEKWSDYATLLDLTATQYPMLDVPGVVRLEPGDERRRMYDQRGLGAETCLKRMSDGDLALLERLVARSRASMRTLRGAA